jgi:hypothetical protein
LEYRYTGGEGKLVETSRTFHDGRYHVIRFYRDGNEAKMFVDTLPAQVGIVSEVSTGGEGEAGGLLSDDDGKRDLTIYDESNGMISSLEDKITKFTYTSII